MLFRLVGFVLIVAGCALTGEYCSARLRTRARQLERCTALARALGEELRYTMAPVEALMASLGEREQFAPLSFLNRCALLCQEGEVFPRAWERAVRAEAEKLAFSREDLELLLSWGEFLGAADLESQLRQMKLAELALERQRESAWRYSQTQGKLCNTLGILGGVFAVILLW